MRYESMTTVAGTGLRNLTLSARFALLARSFIVLRVSARISPMRLGAGLISSLPDSIFERSRTSLMTESMWSPALRMRLTARFMRLGSSC